MATPDFDLSTAKPIQVATPTPTTEPAPTPDFDLSTAKPIVDNSTLWDDVPAIASKLPKGISELLTTAQLMTPGGVGNRMMNPYTPTLGEYFINILNKQGYKEKEPKTVAGNILGEMARYAPSMLMGGGPGALKSTLVGGATAGLFKAAGASETAQDVAGGAASFLPDISRTISNLFRGAQGGLERTAIGGGKRYRNKRLKGMSKAQQLDLLALEEAPIQDVIDAVKSRGVLDGPNDLSSLNTKNKTKLGELADDAETILAQADINHGDIYTPNDIDWKFSEDYIQGHSADAKKLREQLKNYKDDVLNQEWDGSLVDLNRKKSQLYDKQIYDSISESKEFFRYIAADMRRFYQKKATEILGKTLPEAGDVLAGIGRMEGEHIMFRDMLIEAGKLEDTIPGLMKAVKWLGNRPLSAAGLAGISSIVGPMGPQMLAFALLTGALGTPRGQLAAAKGVGGVSKLFGAFGGDTPAGIIPALSDLMGEKQDETDIPSGGGGFGGGGSGGPTLFGSKKKMTTEENEGLGIEDAIRTVAEEFSLNPKVLRAIVEQESSFKPEAISDAGAAGLMQLMPDTAMELANKLGLGKDYDVLDPMTNLRLGASYYKQLLDKFQDHELALTAYHSGPGRVQRLLAKNKATSLRNILDDLGPVGRRYAAAVLNRI